MDLPQPVLPTIATYWPGRILMDISSTMSGEFSVYLNDTLFSSMPPDRRLITCLFSAISGTASKNGLTISSMGFIWAIVSAMPESAINAPETIAYAVLNA